MQKLAIAISSALATSIILTGCGGGASDSQPDPTPPVQPATPSSYALNIAYAAQQTPDWCWAAAEQMALSAHGIGITQAEIVDVTDGAVVDTPGSDTQVVQGLDYFSNNEINAQEIYSPLSFDQIQNAISGGHPVLVGYQSPYQGEGHFVVIYGYTSSGNVLIADPIFGEFSVPYAVSFSYGGPGASALVWAFSIVA